MACSRTKGSPTWVQKYVQPVIDDLRSRYRDDLPPVVQQIYNVSATLHAGLDYLNNGIQSLEAAINAPGLSTSLAMMPGLGILSESQTLRVTPAMQAGISDHVWSLEEIVGLLG